MLPRQLSDADELLITKTFIMLCNVFFISFILYFIHYKRKEKQFDINTNVVWSRMTGSRTKTFCSILQTGWLTLIGAGGTSVWTLGLFPISSSTNSKKKQKKNKDRKESISQSDWQLTIDYWLVPPIISNSIEFHYVIGLKDFCDCVKVNPLIWND